MTEQLNASLDSVEVNVEEILVNVDIQTVKDVPLVIHMVDGGGATKENPSSSDCVKKSDGTANTCGPCPDRSNAHYRNKMPENFHLNDGNQPTKTWFPASHAGAEAITDCRLSYTYTNDRGMFSQDSVPYSTETGKYDNGFENNPTGKPAIYYNVIFPGYYGQTQVYNGTCDASKYQLYQDAKPCPAGQYCTGVEDGLMCKNKRDQYPETLGYDGKVSAGYYSTGGAKTEKHKKVKNKN